MKVTYLHILCSSLRVVASSKICCYAKYEIVGDVKTNLHHRRRQLNKFLSMKSMTKVILYSVTRKLCWPLLWITDVMFNLFLHNKHCILLMFDMLKWFHLISIQFLPLLTMYLEIIKSIKISLNLYPMYFNFQKSLKFRERISLNYTS